MMMVMDVPEIAPAVSAEKTLATSSDRRRRFDEWMVPTVLIPVFLSLVLMMFLLIRGPA